MSSSYFPVFKLLRVQEQRCPGSAVLDGQQCRLMGPHLMCFSPDNKSHLLFLRPLKCNRSVARVARGAGSSCQPHPLLPAPCQVSVKAVPRGGFSSHRSWLGGEVLLSGWPCVAPAGAWRQEGGCGAGAPREAALLSASAPHPSAERPQGRHWAGRNVSMSMAKVRAPGPCSHL